MFNTPLPQGLGGYGQLSQPAPQLQGTFGNYAYLPGGGNPYGAMSSYAMGGGGAQNWGFGVPGQRAGGGGFGGGGFGGGGFGGGGGGMGGGVQAALDAATLANQQARRANNRRYNQALGMNDNVIANKIAGNQRTDQMYGNQKKLVAQLGADERQDIADRSAVQEGKDMNQMVQNGLQNTTVAQALARGRKRSDDRSYLNQTMAETEAQAGVIGRRAANQQAYDLSRNPILDKIQTISSRQDSYPDLSNLYQAAYGAGRG